MISLLMVRYLTDFFLSMLFFEDGDSSIGLFGLTGRLRQVRPILTSVRNLLKHHGNKRHWFNGIFVLNRIGAFICLLSLKK